MKALSACLLCVLFTCAGAATKWAVYRNARFGFAIDRPASLHAGPPPENGDGLVFNGKGAEVRAYGLTAGVFTLQEQFRMSLERLRKGGRVTSARQGRTSFVIRGRVGTNDFYQRTIQGPNAFATVEVSSPASGRRSSQAMAERIGKSLRFL